MPTFQTKLEAHESTEYSPQYFRTGAEQNSRLKENFLILKTPDEELNGDLKKQQVLERARTRFIFNLFVFKGGNKIWMRSHKLSFEKKNEIAKLFLLYERDYIMQNVLVSNSCFK